MVYGSGLENRRGATLRGFESHSLRHIRLSAWRSLASAIGLGPIGRGFESLCTDQGQFWGRSSAVERLLRKQDVVGPIPTGSTISSQNSSVGRALDL